MGLWISQFGLVWTVRRFQEKPNEADWPPKIQSYTVLMHYWKLGSCKCYQGLQLHRRGGLQISRRRARALAALSCGGAQPASVKMFMCLMTGAADAYQQIPTKSPVFLFSHVFSQVAQRDIQSCFRHFLVLFTLFISLVPWFTKLCNTRWSVHGGGSSLMATWSLKAGWRDW